MAEASKSDDINNAESSPSNDNGGKNEFEPVLYNFRVSPMGGDTKTFALQLPFSVLFDNLILVLWSVYGKSSKIQIGVNQIQWALEFIKCMKQDYSYTECVGQIVRDLEVQLIKLYAKIGEKLLEMKTKQKNEENDAEEKSSKESEVGQPIDCVSYNEKDILDKLETVKLPIDPETGEPKYLKELDQLGKRKNKHTYKKPVDNKASKTYMIGALQKILNKTTEEETKTEVEELIKGLKVQQNPTTDGGNKLSNKKSE